jgi:hypothetical protein
MLKITFANEQDIEYFMELDAQAYQDAVVPVEIVKQWFHKNREIFRVLRNREGNVLGDITLMPLKEGTIQKFMRQEIEEKDIRQDDILLFDDNDVNIYIASIIVPPCRNASMHAFLLIRHAMKFLNSKNNIKAVYATAVNKKGYDLAKNFGFKEVWVNKQGEQFKSSFMKYEMKK